MDSRHLLFVFILMAFFIFTGCGAVIVGGAAYGGYKGATDERTINTIMDDSYISTTVKSKMIADEFIKARHIDVDVLNGVVYLVGVVGSLSQKRLAGDIAKSVEGVKRVENQLIAGDTATGGQMLNDTILTSKIKTALLKAPDIRSNNIDVDTNYNVVTLTGMVKSETQKNQVLSIVQEVVGDRQVVSNLTFSN